MELNKVNYGSFLATRTRTYFQHNSTNVGFWKSFIIKRPVSDLVCSKSYGSMNSKMCLLFGKRQNEMKRMVGWLVGFVLVT